MIKLERLKKERVGVRRQVDLHENKHGQADTIWHTILKRLDKDIAEIEKKKRKKKQIEKENNDG